MLFTSGGTESNNTAIFGLARSNTHKGNHILTTEVEHPSVLESVKQLEQEGFDVEYLQADKNGVISLEELRTKVRKDTILVSMMHVNNEMGAIQPIFEAAKLFMNQVAQLFTWMLYKALESYQYHLTMKMDQTVFQFLAIKFMALKVQVY